MNKVIICSREPILTVKSGHVILCAEHSVRAGPQIRIVTIRNKVILCMVDSVLSRINHPIVCGSFCCPRFSVIPFPPDCIIRIRIFGRSRLLTEIAVLTRMCDRMVSIIYIVISRVKTPVSSCVDPVSFGRI